MIVNPVLVALCAFSFGATPASLALPTEALAMPVAALVAPNATLGAPAVKWNAPKVLIMDGRPYVVHVEFEAPDDGAPLAAWLLEPAAMSINGKALAAKSETHTFKMSPRMKLTADIDIAGEVAKMPDLKGGSFKLQYGSDLVQSEPIEVTFMQPAEKGLNFMTMPVENLANYQVYMETNRGPMYIGLWPDVAPNHVRNFLDLCYTGFYNNLTFHRVIPGFMIQGGDPLGNGQGQGPRKVKAEFNTRKHEAGVLSMARGANDADSASSQFFIMHGAAPHLDGAYSAFGKLITGNEVVDRIVNARTLAEEKPTEPQVIQKVTVIKAANK